MDPVLPKVRKFIEEVKAHGTLNRLEISAGALAVLRDELGLAMGEPVFIDGVPILALTPRAELLAQASVYAVIRWNVHMSPDDAASLFKAVEDDDLEELIPIIIAQHFDDHGFPDPVDEMTHDQVQEMKEALVELGIVDPTL